MHVGSHASNAHRIQKNSAERRHSRGQGKSGSRVAESTLDTSDVLAEFSELTEKLVDESSENYDVHQHLARRMRERAPRFTKFFDEKLEKMTQCASRCMERGPLKHARADYTTFSEDCEALIFHPAFDVFIFLFIVLSGICTSIEVHHHLNQDEHFSDDLRTFLKISGGVTVVVFACEIVVKLAACGETPIKYFTDANDGMFNTFDFLIVVVSLINFGTEGGVVSVFRLLRLIKLMSKLSALRQIMLGLVAGMKAVSSIMVLMLLVTFLFSIIGHFLFHDNDPAHFDTVESGMLSLFVFATLTSWGNTAQINYFGESRLLVVYTSRAAASRAS